MAEVVFDHVTRIYPGNDKPSVDDLNLDIKDGEFLVLVGPSGCGKSTTLRMLAGLEEVNKGRILIGGKDVTTMQPKDRDIAMVFQNYALYPHMTVADNMGFALKIAGIYVPNPDAGMYSVIPTAFVSFDFSALGKTFGQVFKTDFSGVGILNFFAVMFSFLFVDLFDTLGTLIGVASKADMLDEDGKLPHIKGALMADSIATCAGAVLGTSTTTTFVESASGVTEGGRTGLTAMTTGILFLLATIFSPLFLTIPSFATAPALIIVGFYMMGSAVKIDFNDPSEGIPAFLTILAMPTAYSISEGIAIGVISWTLINLVTGKAKEKKISPLMYVLTVLFILKYVFL